MSSEGAIVPPGAVDGRGAVVTWFHGHIVSFELCPTRVVPGLPAAPSGSKELVSSTSNRAVEPLPLRPEPVHVGVKQKEQRVLGGGGNLRDGTSEANVRSPVRVAFVAAEPAVAMDRGTGGAKPQQECLRFGDHRPLQRGRLLRLRVESRPADNTDHPIGRPELKRVRGAEQNSASAGSVTPMKSRVKRLGAGSSNRQ